MSHALLSPSGSHRWLACPPSARLEAMFPDTTSEVAEEGTLAHHIAEVSLKRSIGAIDSNTAAILLQRATTHVNYSFEMTDYVDTYISAIAEVMNFNSKIYVEYKVDLSAFVPGCYGTVDACVINGETLHVFDLKYGKGVKVDADENPQLMMYALGVISDAEINANIKDVICHIVQPRLSSHSTYYITSAELTAWGNRTLRHAAIEAYTGGGEFSTGEHCRFCKAKGVCRKLANECSGINDKEVAVLTPQEISDKLAILPSVEAWCAALKEQALRSALNGIAIPKYKLVEGKSSRKFTDEAALLKALIANGIDEKVVTKTTLVTLGELEKLLGKKAFANDYGKFIIKPQGKPSLVPEDDKREAIGANTAASDFDKVNI